MRCRTAATLICEWKARARCARRTTRHLYAYQPLILSGSVSTRATGWRMVFPGGLMPGSGMNWNMVLLRGLWRPFGVLLASFAAGLLMLRAGASPLTESFAHLGTRIFQAGSLIALAWTGYFCWRLVQWEKGSVQPCRFCGGPLGGQRIGRRMYGRQLSDFRRCYNCGKAAA